MSKTMCKFKKQEFKISAVLGVRLIQLQKKKGHLLLLFTPRNLLIIHLMKLATAWNEHHQIMGWIGQDTKGTCCGLVNGHNPRIKLEERSKTMQILWTEM
jgi:hypothetical protein